MNDGSQQQNENKDPFLQRAVEYWLDAANELGYQPLFCEWLITQGYVLKYSIKNTNFEQGKDVVAVRMDGTPHAYQLKGGSINLNRWRTEVKPEIDVLVESAIQHPDIDKARPHVSYLVTNGEIEDSVRSEIVALNEKRWKDTPLRTLTRGDLLNGFLEMVEGILPKDAEMYKRLIDLIFADGTGQPDTPKISAFLCEILNINNDHQKKEQRRRDIAAAMLYTTMIAGPYRRVKNHASVVRIMVLLLSFVLHVVDKHSLEDKYWIESYQIIWNDIIETAKLLEVEVNTQGFEPAFTDPLDTDLIPFRKHSAVSIIYPLKLSQYICGDEEWKTMLSPTVASKYKGSIAIWGEASFLPAIFISLIFKNREDAKVSAIKLLGNAVEQIIQHNGRKSKEPIGLVPPYYGFDFAVKLNVGLLDSEFEDKYKLSSYYLKPLIELLVRLNERNFVSEHWKEISFMHFEEFIPENSVDFYLWRTEKGENLSILPKEEKSWKELVKETESFEGKGLPPSIKRFPHFLPFLLSLLPQRVTSDSMGFLFNVCSK